jgi:hypothetical protein
LKELTNREKTAETIRLVLKFLFQQRILAWRQNVMGMPIRKDGMIVGYKGSGKTGLPDIMGIMPPNGRQLLIEVKTGKDKLRPEQEAFLEQSRKYGAIVLIIKDFEDFMEQWNGFRTS